MAGRIILPFHGPYNASKWALEALAESYKTELLQFGIECCIIEPGGYPTGFMENQMKPSDNSRNAGYGESMNAPETMVKNFKIALERNPNQNPQNVADAISNLVNFCEGKRPLRTVVDSMGLGGPIEGYNVYYQKVMQNINRDYGL